MQDQWETKRVLITVKTQPIPSRTYDELVCTAGVDADGSFIRLYPINFRDLDYDKQYKKYQWIDVEVKKHVGRGVRKESYRPNSETIRLVGEPVSSKNNWTERARFVLQRKAASMEVLRDQQQADRTSLGIFKPRNIEGFVETLDEANWKPSFEAALRQYRLWETRNRTKVPPRKLPFKFSYKFRCDDSRCNGHKMMIEDWEVSALFWRTVDAGADHKEACRHVRKKFLDEMYGSDRDTHFYVGTILAHPKSWVIIGVWWPKVSVAGAQHSLPF